MLLHTDAAQACGKIPLDVVAMHVHLASLSAHKTYGPKGVGALYVRRRTPRVRLVPLLHGGGHERATQLVASLVDSTDGETVRPGAVLRGDRVLVAEDGPRAVADQVESGASVV